MIFSVGFPAPCPARTSMRVTSGLRCGDSASSHSTCCSVAVSLWLCSGTTLSSWSPAGVKGRAVGMRSGQSSCLLWLEPKMLGVQKAGATDPQSGRRPTALDPLMGSLAKLPYDLPTAMSYRLCCQFSQSKCQLTRHAS